MADIPPLTFSHIGISAHDLEAQADWYKRMLGLFETDRGTLPADDGTPIPLMGARQWLAVMGSVGQPRDQNPMAAYGLLDTDTRELTYLRVAYDIETAVEKIHAAKLPQILAARLFIGR